MDWGSHVPRTLNENLAFRLEVNRKCLQSSKYRSEVLEACASDFLFWLNTFGFTMDPRLADPVVPWVSYPFQDAAFRKMVAAVGKADVLIEKSRDMGATWMVLSVFLWRWLFRPYQQFLVLSRTENEVDKADNMKALFPKLEFLLNYLPKWMAPDFTRNHMLLSNKVNKSVISGEATTANTGRGGRFTAIMKDEFAYFELADGYRSLDASQKSTNCRFYNSTPNGTTGAFYEVREMMVKNKGNVIRMHWSEHPVQNRGMYTAVDGKLKVLDKDYDFPADYPFILDGKLRSPYYDNECSRHPNPKKIAQELDIDYGGSGSRFFDVALLEARVIPQCQAPWFRGELEYSSDGEPEGFDIRDGGGWQLWLWFMVADWKPPHDREYVVSVDISAGTGASNSAISIGDRVERKKVAAFASPFIRPEALAVLAVAAAKWFNNALLVWDAGGPGHQFGDKVQELGYSHLYEWRDKTVVGRPKMMKRYGFYAPSGPKRKAFMGAYAEALYSGNFTNPDEEAVKECYDYMHSPNGGVEHSGSKSDDPSNAKENHGDRAWADMMLWEVIRPLARLKPIAARDEYPIGSFGHRMKMAEAKPDTLDGDW